MRADAARLLDSLGARIDPRTPLRELGIAQRHMVAIARALSIEARVVIMDEPTAALSQSEVEELYELIEGLKAAGKAILFISHKFEEVFRIADRYTVFRDGRMVGCGEIGDVTDAELVRLMVGRDIAKVFPKREVEIGGPVLEVDGLSHPTEFADISFTLRRGEILGLYALIGSGRSELCQALFGATQPSRGTITLEGKRLRLGHPGDAVRAGLVYVPEERGRQGAILPMSIAENISLPSLRRTAKSGLLRTAEEFALARTYAARLDLRAAHLSQPVGELSGRCTACC
jgi:rhamnose transport system ATP-binding protein